LRFDVEVGGLDILHVHLEVLGGDQRQHGPHRGPRRARRPDVLVVNAHALGEPLGYVPGLVARDGPFGITLDVENPAATSHFGTRWQESKLPGVCRTERRVLRVHAFLPEAGFRAGKSLGAGLGRGRAPVGLRHHLQDRRRSGRGLPGDAGASELRRCLDGRQAGLHLFGPAP